MKKRKLCLQLEIPCWYLIWRGEVFRDARCSRAWGRLNSPRGQYPGGIAGKWRMGRGVVAVWSGGIARSIVGSRYRWGQIGPFSNLAHSPPVGVHGGLSDSGWLCMVARYAMTTPRENREVNTDTESKKIQADRWPGSRTGSRDVRCRVTMSRTSSTLLPERSPSPLALISSLA